MHNILTRLPQREIKWRAQLDNFAGNFPKLCVRVSINKHLDKLPFQVIYNIIKYTGKIQNNLG